MWAYSLSLCCHRLSTSRGICTIVVVMTKVKTEKIEMRVSFQDKQKIQRAARIEGKSVTQWVMTLIKAKLKKVQK